MKLFQSIMGMSQNQRRFSDKELIEMKTDIKNLSVRFDKHEKNESVKFDAMISAVNKNTESIDKLAIETLEIVNLHRDIQGATRIGKKLQDFLIWVTKWGIVGAFALVIANFIKKL